MTIIAAEIQPLENICERSARAVVLHIDAGTIDEKKLDQLHLLLDRNRGECSVLFDVKLADGAIARVQPNQLIRVKATSALTSSIQEIMTDCRVELVVQRASGAAR